jgi:hypothetical protein
MKAVHQEEIARFMPEIKIEDGSPQDGICVRCFRKKYNCIMFFLLVAFLTVQTGSVLINKLDDEQLQSITKNFYKHVKKFFIATRNYNGTSLRNISQFLEYD